MEQNRVTMEALQYPWQHFPVLDLLDNNTFMNAQVIYYDHKDKTFQLYMSVMSHLYE